MFETLIADVRFALRWLRRSPGFAMVIIGSLAVGIGLNTALFTIVDATMFRPLPVSHPDRLVDVYTSSGDGDQYATSSYPDFLDFQSQNSVFSGMLGYSPSLDAVSLTDRSRLALGEIVTGTYFQVLGVSAVAGRTLLPDDDRPGAPRAVVIAHRLWVREFGGQASAIGQSIRIHGRPYTIVGVAPATFTGMVSILSAELWTPATYVDDVEPAGIIDAVPSPTGRTRLERRGMRWMFVKGRLKDEATIDAASANLRVIAQRLQASYPQTNKDRRLSALRTSDVHIHPMADRTLVPIATGLMVGVGLVLLVACGNVASMLLAHASGRQKEIGIRLAIGASRGRLVRQMLTESAILSALGAIAAVLVAWWLTRAATLLPLPLPVPLVFDLRIDGRVLAFTAGITILASLAAGLAPALKATRPNLVSELKNEVPTATVGGRRWTLRDALVVAQVAATMVLLVAAGLLTRSLFRAQQTAVGFSTRGLAVVSAELGLIGYSDEQADRFYERAMARVRAIPGVESAALLERVPFSINYNRNQIFIPGRHGAGDRGLVIDVTRVSPEYFSTIGVPILQGRNFTSTDTRISPRVAIVNDTLARRLWPGERAIGKRLRAQTWDGPEYEVVGTCADYKVNTVGEPPTPYIHFAHSQRPDAAEAILARTRGNADALVAGIVRELTSMEPNVIVLDKQTMDTQVNVTLLPARLGAVSVIVVSTVAMLLASIGLYGVIAYSVARRTREIGIRMALGANTTRVLTLVVRQGSLLVAAGLGIGTLLALGAARAVSGALYDISFIDPAAWGAAVALLATVSALANIVPARRALRVEPMTALRQE